MITGDQALTACHVAGQVHIISRPALILSPSRAGDKYDWISPDETETIPFRYLPVFFLLLFPLFVWFIFFQKQFHCYVSKLPA